MLTMSKVFEKLINKPTQKKRDPLFIEVSGNPWFLTNLNHVGFYLQEPLSGELEDAIKKKPGF